MRTPDDLLNALLVGVPGIPGVDSVHLFGSIARNAHDALSDVDVQVFVADVDAAWSNRYQLVQHIAPILLELPLVAPDDARAATFLFQGLSPVTKLDLGVQPTDQLHTWTRQYPGRCLWRREAQLDAGFQSPVASPLALAMSPRDPVTLAILDQLLGAVRYVKARRRGHIVVAWRFATALAEAALAVSVSEITCRPYTGHKLTTPEYVALDQHLARSSDGSLADALFFAGPAAMDARVRGWVDTLDHYQQRVCGDSQEIHAALTTVAEWIRQVCNSS